MGLRPKTRFKVWEVKHKQSKAGKDLMNIKVTTSKKVGDKWETDFSSFALVFGEARKKLEHRLKENDAILVTEFDLTKNYNKELQKEFISLVIYDADLLNDKGEIVPYDENEAKKAAEKAPSEGFMNIADDLPDLPFN